MSTETDSIRRAVRGIVPGLSNRDVDLLTANVLAEGWTPPAPPPLTEEPTDLAARVADKDGNVWAYLPINGGFWVTASPFPVTWEDLFNEQSPLRLWEPTTEETSR